MRGIITDSSAPGGLRLAYDLPEPDPAPNELVLGVRAYSLNAGEMSLVKQRPDGWQPGQDVAGVVLRAADDGSGPAEGQRVVAYPEQGGWAERIPVPAGWVAALPAEVSFEQAAALPVAGITALRALRLGGSLLGRNVLVTGATGGVGQVGVQLAVASGARVTALVTGPDRVADAQALGARQVATSLRDSGLGPFHLVLDGVGGPGLRELAALLAPEATIALYGNLGDPSQFSLGDFYRAGAFNAKLVAFISVPTSEGKGADLAVLAGLTADGRLRPRIGLIADWHQTADAFGALARRDIRGKAVLTIS
jgi:NADPH:quinone reductase-like Zn-dependent oxidoreductase